jgi:hypothetical protein
VKEPAPDAAAVDDEAQLLGHALRGDVHGHDRGDDDVDAVVPRVLAKKIR